jgi:glyoxylase-like metal-dependent hydrolase (beta-lactamase superfamily II)
MCRFGLKRLLSVVGLFLLPSSSLLAADNNILESIKVTDSVWAIVGPLSNRTPQNLGNNATFGLVVTSEGAVLVDPGGSYLGAKQLHGVVKKITDKPVKYVINTGGQDHRWFGNDYFSRLGAKVIASKNAVADQKQRFNSQWNRMANTAGEAALQGTKAKHADIVFDTSHTFSLGGIAFEVHHKGQAHTPGDSYVWLPARKVIFSGDIVYTERMLNVSEYSNGKSWLTVFEAMAAHKPVHVVPGHGHPTDLNTATRDTYDYLAFLRNSVTAFMEEGHDISDIGKIDQSAFSYLQNFDSLSGRNIQKVYREMEWE